MIVTHWVTGSRRNSGTSRLFDPRNSLLVEIDILAGASSPRPILAHARGHELFPRVATVLVRITGAGESGFAGRHAVVTKGKAVRGFGSQRLFVAIHDGVGEPAGRVDDGNRAVAEAVKLIQAARFIAAGHQEDIRCRFDLMRQFVGKSGTDRDALPVLPC